MLKYRPGDVELILVREISERDIATTATDFERLYVNKNINKMICCCYFIIYCNHNQICVRSFLIFRSHLLITLHIIILV